MQSRAGSSTDHLITPVSGARHAQNDCSYVLLKKTTARQPPFDHPGCRECGKKFTLSRCGFVECEDCDKYWGLMNGMEGRCHTWRPDSYASLPRATSQPSTAMRSQDASHQHNQQQLPPLVSNYVKPKHDVPPPPPHPARGSSMCSHRRSGCGGRSTVGMISHIEAAQQAYDE